MNPAVAFCILAHNNLERVAEVAAHMAASGAPVAIHIDAGTDDAAFEALRRSLTDTDGIYFADRVKCAWGMFSLIEATLNAVGEIMSRHPDVGHVCLTSGADLPIRPISDLGQFLSENPGRDFIESVSLKDEKWVGGGLTDERFSLYFPVCWRSRRKTFDRLVDIQRRIKIKRSIPKPLQPHLGSQWWCLSGRTLNAILSDPDLPKYRDYFRWTWIPDESFFQTLVRKHSSKERIDPRALTLYRWDGQGKPFEFYNDHIDLLSRSDYFLARKISPRADDLYAHFLSDKIAPRRGFLGDAPENAFDSANDQAGRGSPGLVSQCRFPLNGHNLQVDRARPYTVFVCQDPWLMRRLGDLLKGRADLFCHGELFNSKRIEFADDLDHFAGYDCDHVKIRDYNPRIFLSNVLWASRRRATGLMFRTIKGKLLEELFWGDHDARIIYVRHAWMLNLLTEAGVDLDAAKPSAPPDLDAEFLERVQRRRFLDRTYERSVLDWKGKVTPIDASDLVAAPEDVLSTIRRACNLPALNDAAKPRPLTDAKKRLIGGFARSLHQAGCETPLGWIELDGKAVQKREKIALSVSREGEKAARTVESGS